jgi:hypothetical protein
MVSLLKWWLIICLTILGLLTGVYFDMHNHIYDADVTKLSFLILAIFSCTSIWIGNKTYRLEKYAEYEQTTNVGWFIAETCLALGMVGTVTGFLLMLGTAFSNIDVSNSASLQKALGFMAVGMSTALYTTLVGLICSLIIKIQLVNLEVAIDDP